METHAILQRGLRLMSQGETSKMEVAAELLESTLLKRGAAIRNHSYANNKRELMVLEKAAGT